MLFTHDKTERKKTFISNKALIIKEHFIILTKSSLFIFVFNAIAHLSGKARILPGMHDSNCHEKPYLSLFGFQLLIVTREIMSFQN